MTKFSKNSKRLLGAAAACALLVGWSVSSQAQTCTVGNWDASSGALADMDGTDNSNGLVGTPPVFRRYAGPCAFEAPFGGGPDWVEDSGMVESNYIARFYVYLNDLTGDDVPIFEAYDGSNAALFGVYFTSDSGAGVIGFDATGNGIVDQSGSAEPGWNSVELSYDGVNLLASINGADDLSAASSSGDVAAVRLGDIDGAGGGSAVFDDFDSRRTTRPGRLCRGLTDATRDALTFADAIAIFNDAASNSTVTTGQPDYNEDGLVTFSDAIAVFNRSVSASTRPCAENR